MRGGRYLTAAIVAVALFSPLTATAQVQAGTEVAHDSSTWHFDNPSSYDTTELVPHFFEQQYRLDNLWFTASAAYRAGIDWLTAVALTPVRQATATDYDTFLDPGGVVWVAGTSGDARMHSFRIAQSVDLGRVGGTRFSGGYRLRVDLADFLAGDRTDVRNGVLIARTIVTSREYTNAQTHEIFVRGEAAVPLGRAWELRLAGDAAPASVNRLAIRLPDKYPGQTLVFRTTNMTTSGRIDLARGTGRWPLTVSTSLSRSWNNHSDQWVRRSAVAVGISLGRTW